MATIFRRIGENDPSGGLSQRQRRAGELLRKALAEIFQRWETWSGGVFPSMTTITRVHLSGDLRHATVFVSPLQQEDAKHVVKTLNNTAPLIQKRLAGKISLKFLPVLRFKLDTALEEAQRLEQLFKQPKIQQDLERL